MSGKKRFATQPADPGNTLSSKAVQDELERIFSSPDFEASQRSKDFLRYVVEETLSGRGFTLKGYTIATHVFGRGRDFDPTLDPIVRIEAGKLRRALERYYLVTGHRNPVHIEIPKGTNVPVFHEQAERVSDEITIGRTSHKSGSEGSWPTVLVRPLKNLTEDPELSYWGMGLATELATEITRCQEIRVLMYGAEGQARRASDSIARFVVGGSVRTDRAGIKVAVHLIDTKTNEQIWSDTHQSDFEAARVFAFQEEVAQVIIAKIAGEHGIIYKTLSSESRNNPPSELKAYEAILRYYEYNRSFTSENFRRAFEALQNAKDIEPGCGLVWSMLGRLYGNIYSLELPGFETALEKAVLFSEKGVQLNPESQRARAILAFARMFSDEIPAALAEVHRAYQLNPNSLFFLDGIGYMMTLLGEWERGTALIRKLIQLNPYYGLYVHYALWVDWMRQGKYEQAYLETRNFKSPAIFWEPLMQATSFGQLGRHEEGKRAVENLLKLKPDFPSRGRILIKHYIKFDDIVDRMIDGLGKAGLKVE
jgi:adenylate cyclase